MSFFTIESLEQRPTRHLFTILGVRYMATPLAWISLIYPLVIGGIISLFVQGNWTLADRIGLAVGFGVAFLVAYYWHGLGHIISGHLVGAPMHSTLITATVQLSQYDETLVHPSWVHIGRTVGGPIANLIACVIASAIYLSGQTHPILLFFAVMNGVLFFAILPGPSLDGSVIVREWRDWKPKAPTQ